MILPFTSQLLFWPKWAFDKRYSLTSLTGRGISKLPHRRVTLVGFIFPPSKRQSLSPRSCFHASKNILNISKRILPIKPCGICVYVCSNRFVNVCQPPTPMAQMVHGRLNSKSSTLEVSIRIKNGHSKMLESVSDIGRSSNIFLDSCRTVH